MKMKAVVLGIAMTGMFSLPAFADAVSHARDAIPLEEGVSDTRLLPAGKPDRYRIVIEQPTTLEVNSEHFAGEHQSEPLNKQMKATLYDASGNVEATASDLRGHFQISERVQPGEYILEVTGQSLGGSGHDEESGGRYTLHVDFK